MSPVLHIGDMVMVCNNNVNGTSFENLRIGNIVVFNAFAANAVEEGITIIGRVAAKLGKGNAELKWKATRLKRGEWDSNPRVLANMGLAIPRPTRLGDPRFEFSFFLWVY